LTPGRIALHQLRRKFRSWSVLNPGRAPAIAGRSRIPRLRQRSEITGRGTRVGNRQGFPGGELGPAFVKAVKGPCPWFRSCQPAAKPRAFSSLVRSGVCRGIVRT
jgi:hypothetical protein